MKNTLDGMNTKLDTIEEKMSELEDTSVETIPNDPWKGNDKPGSAKSISAWGRGPLRGSRIQKIGSLKRYEGVEKTEKCLKK